MEPAHYNVRSSQNVYNVRSVGSREISFTQYHSRGAVAPTARCALQGDSGPGLGGRGSGTVTLAVGGRWGMCGDYGMRVRGLFHGSYDAVVGGSCGVVLGLGEAMLTGASCRTWHQR